MSNTVWMQPPGGGPPVEVEDDGRGVTLTPLLVQGYCQCQPPEQPPPERKRRVAAIEEVNHAS